MDGHVNMSTCHDRHDDKATHLQDGGLLEGSSLQLGFQCYQSILPFGLSRNLKNAVSSTAIPKNMVLNEATSTAIDLARNLARSWLVCWATWRDVEKGYIIVMNVRIFWDIFDARNGLLLQKPNGLSGSAGLFLETLHLSWTFCCYVSFSIQFCEDQMQSFKALAAAVFLFRSSWHDMKSTTNSPRLETFVPGVGDDTAPAPKPKDGLIDLNICFKQGLAGCIFFAKTLWCFWNGKSWKTQVLSKAQVRNVPELHWNLMKSGRDAKSQQDMSLKMRLWLGTNYFLQCLTYQAQSLF